MDPSMTEDDPTPKARQLRLSTVIRQEGAKAYFWRERLEDIAEGIDLGHTDKQAASQQLVAVMQEVRNAIKGADSQPDRDAGDKLREHFQMGIDEVFELAESRQVPLSAAIRRLGLAQSSGKDR
jgi:hypothetical protein